MADRCYLDLTSLLGDEPLFLVDEDIQFNLDDFLDYVVALKSPFPLSVYADISQSTKLVDVVCRLTQDCNDYQLSFTEHLCYGEENNMLNDFAADPAYAQMMQDLNDSLVLRQRIFHLYTGQLPSIPKSFYEEVNPDWTSSVIIYSPERKLNVLASSYTNKGKRDFLARCAKNGVYFADLRPQIEKFSKKKIS